MTIKLKKYIKREQKIKEQYRKIKQNKAKKKELVRNLAHALWELNGKQIGRDKQDWEKAEELLRPGSWMRRYLKLPIRKINWHIPISLFISGFSLAALLIHLGYLPLKVNEQIKSEQIKNEQIKNEQIKFDSPALILFFLFLSPWFPFILEKATLPGGLNLEFRKIKEQQNRQEKEIKDINDIMFILLFLVTEYEKKHLLKLNSSARFTYEFRASFEEELRRLLALKLIERHPGKGIRSAKKDKRWDNDLKEHFYITDKGKDYLARIERFGEDEE